MNDDLYFIPIIAKALQQRDPEESLRRAFDQIRSVGRQPRYGLGLEQFERFMATVEIHLKKSKAELPEVDVVSTLIAELVTETFEGSDEEKQKVLSIIQSQPQWRKEYANFAAEIERLDQRPQGIGISIFRENETFRSLMFTNIPDTKIICGITPGGYHISFTTGRLIWEGEFTERDLIWTRAFPGKPLELAADTTERKCNPTREISALDGEITIRVFAGLESSQIEITMKSAGDTR